MSYSYDAFGNCTPLLHVYSDAAYNNPFRYRGYYYDIDLNLYYLNSRYYDSFTGRFISADGYISTGQGLLGYNMFAYCNNNPVNRADHTGMFWKEIGTAFSNAWNGVVNWAKNTFGASSSVTKTITESETQIIPDPSPITIKEGTNTSKTISEQGDSSKPVSVYANMDAQHPIKSSSAGININVADFTLNLSVGLDDIGLYGSLANGNESKSFGMKLNLSEFRIGFEGSRAIQWDKTTATSYTNVSVSGWTFIAAYLYATTGQYVQSPSYVYWH